MQQAIGNCNDEGEDSEFDESLGHIPLEYRTAITLCH